MLGHVATHHLPSIVTKIVACDNMYKIESKDELVFVGFFVHPIPLIVETNITCNLLKVTRGILVANVTYSKNLVIRSS
jgi:hypothetical protein